MVFPNTLLTLFRQLIWNKKRAIIRTVIN